MDFIYDNNGKPYALKYDGTTYYYVLNLQGDVISIITHWGEAYGSYTYDAWGNIISQSGWLAGINPIRRIKPQPKLFCIADLILFGFI